MILTKITDNPKQDFSYILSIGEEVKFHIEYKTRISCWFLTLKYKTFEVNNIRVTSETDNILNQFKNILPFVLKCNTTTGFRPFFLNDFVNGNNNLEIIEDV